MLQKGQDPVIEPLRKTLRGPAKNTWRDVIFSQQFYLVTKLSIGSCCNIFRAVTSDGFDCVVKMYIREYNDDNSSITDFKRLGAAQVEREAEVYKLVYSELRSFIWTEELCGRPCLILPFFEDVCEACQMDEVTTIADLYNEKFLANRTGITKEKACWDHVDRFKERLYIRDIISPSLFESRGVRKSAFKGT